MINSAFMLALIHYVFFKLLDGRHTDDASVPRQSQISMVSLLLVTGFRASIVIVLGICFTQYLWYLLRFRCLKLSLIEDLFQIRSNVVGIARLQVLRQTPLLFLVAVLSWLVPLAMVYPPGALTIQTELHRSMTRVNASVMNPGQGHIVEGSSPRSLARTRADAKNLTLTDPLLGKYVLGIRAVNY